jgi:hypothetical protein
LNGFLEKPQEGKSVIYIYHDIIQEYKKTKTLPSFDYYQMIPNVVVEEEEKEEEDPSTSPSNIPL